MVRATRRLGKDIYGQGFVTEQIQSMLQSLGVTESVFPNEQHVAGYNFLGPKTDLKGREKAGPPLSEPVKTKGKNAEKLDAEAKKHDYAYKEANDKLKAKTIDQQEFKEEIHDADKAFIEEVKKIPTITAKVAEKAILLKKWAEQQGIISFEEFSQSGLGLFKPAHYLKKEKRMKPKIGGFLPALMPFLIPIVSSLSGVLLDKLITHFTKDDKKDAQKGTGVSVGKKPKEEDKKRTYVIDVLDNVTPERQIELLSKTIFD